MKVIVIACRSIVVVAVAEKTTQKSTRPPTPYSLLTSQSCMLYIYIYAKQSIPFQGLESRLSIPQQYRLNVRSDL